MSHKGLFSKLALSAAIGVSGAADAQSNSAGVHISAFSIIHSGMQYKDSEEGFASPSLNELAARLEYAGDKASIEDCYKKLEIAEKPVAETQSTDAQQIVNCVDQKNINKFLNNPSFKDNGILYVFMNKGGRLENFLDVKRSNDFAREVAAECKTSEPVMRDSFLKCARRQVKIEGLKMIGFDGLTICGVTLALAGAGALANRCIRSKKDDDAPEARPS